MAKVKFEKTAKGEVAIVPRADYETLIARLNEKEEDAGTARIVDAANAALNEGRDVLLPLDVSRRLIEGENPVKVLREFRALPQMELALAVGVKQPYLSAIERGERKGPLELHTKLARALGVPLDLLSDMAASPAEADPERFAQRKSAIAKMAAGRAGR